MTRPIRIAHVIDQLAVAGAQRVMLQNIEGLRAPDFTHSVYAVFPDDAMRPDLDRLRVPVIELGARSARDLPIAVLRLWRHLRRSRPDIVHTHVFPADLVGRIAARLAGVPVIVTTFHNPLHEPTRLERSGWTQDLLQRLTYRVARARAIAVSDSVERSVRAVLGEEHAAVIRAIVLDPDRWRPITAVEREAERSSMAIPAGSFVVGCVARIGAQKGQSYLVKALAKCDPSVRLLLIGDGPDREEILRLADRLGVGERVKVTGWLRDPRTAVAACDALVLSSLWEGYPIALLEGMSAALPYVATDVGGVTEIARPGRDALVVPPADPIALATAIERLRSDPSSREAIAGSARARALEIVRDNDVVRELGDLYRSLV